MANQKFRPVLLFLVLAITGPILASIAAPAFNKPQLEPHGESYTPRSTDLDDLEMREAASSDEYDDCFEDFQKVDRKLPRALENPLSLTSFETSGNRQKTVFDSAADVFRAQPDRDQSDSGKSDEPSLTSSSEQPSGTLIERKSEHVTTSASNTILAQTSAIMISSVIGTASITSSMSGSPPAKTLSESFASTPTTGRVSNSPVTEAPYTPLQTPVDELHKAPQSPKPSPDETLETSPVEFPTSSGFRTSKTRSQTSFQPSTTSHHPTSVVASTFYPLPSANRKLALGPGLAVSPNRGVDLSGNLSPAPSRSSNMHSQTWTVVVLIGAILLVSAVALLVIHFFLKARKMKTTKLPSKDSLKGFGAVEWTDPVKPKDKWHPALGDLAMKEKEKPAYKPSPLSKRDSLVSHWHRLNPNSWKPQSGRMSLLPKINALLGRTPSTSSSNGPAVKPVPEVVQSNEKVLDIRPYNLGSRFSVTSSDLAIDETYHSLESLQSLEVVDLDVDEPSDERADLAGSVPTSPNLIDTPILSSSLESQSLLRASSTSVTRTRSSTPGHLRSRSAPQAPEVDLVLDELRSTSTKRPPASRAPWQRHKSQARSMSALTVSSRYPSGVGERLDDDDDVDSDWDIAEAYSRRSERYTYQSRRGREPTTRTSTRRVTAQSANGRNSEYTMYRRSDWI
ncbi:hypothetical protein ONZ45_g14796 [Pleurotus djamor]|nr:hypothetical protein ONZ45_g14796 [Pleurotus djamor]